MRTLTGLLTAHTINLDVGERVEAKAGMEVDAAEEKVEEGEGEGEEEEENGGDVEVGEDGE